MVIYRVFAYSCWQSAILDVDCDIYIAYVTVRVSQNEFD